MMNEKEIQNIPHIGKKLRAARRGQRLSLRELAEKTQVSASMLSKIENGKAYPSVRSLHSIADALSLPITHFFPENQQKKPSLPEAIVAAKQLQPSPAATTVANMTPGEFRIAQAEAALDETEIGFTDEPHHPKEPVVHATTRHSIELLGGIVWERLTQNAEEGVEFLQIYYEVGAKSGEKMSHHSGREFHFVLEGILLLELGFERYLLNAGDSIIFDSTTPHRLSNVGELQMRAISVIFAEKNQ